LCARRTHLNRTLLPHNYLYYTLTNKIILTVWLEQAQNKAKQIMRFNALLRFAVEGALATTVL
jgi:hypothetical protein